MSLPHALIGLLSVQPRSGYELTKAFEADLGRYAWQAGHTSIYPELTKLEQKSLIEVTAEGARGSRTYSATDAGRAELRSWLMDDDDSERPGSGKVRNSFVLRMFLISALDPTDALVVLRRLAAGSAETTADLEKVRAAAGPTLQPGAEGFGQLAAEFGLRQLRATQEWAEWAIEQLRPLADR